MTLSDFFIVWIGKMVKGKKAFITQGYSEANSKNGTMSEGSTLLVGVAGLASNDTIFITGDLPVILKHRNIGYSGTGVSAFIYKSPTYTGGVSDTYQNTNDINPVLGTSQILSGPTVTVTGTLFASAQHFLGGDQVQGKGAPAVQAQTEHILSPNTEYLFRLTSLDSAIQNIASHLSWFEGEPDMPNND